MEVCIINLFVSHYLLTDSLLFVDTGTQLNTPVGVTYLENRKRGCCVKLIIFDLLLKYDSNSQYEVLAKFRSHR